MFITGVAGSGTTLLLSLIRQSCWVGGALYESALAAPSDSILSSRLIDSYERMMAYFNALLLPEELDPQLLRRECYRVYRQVLKRKRFTPPVILDKAPTAHLLRAGKLKAAFPEATFLVIFRDPVANIEGLRRKWRLFAAESLENLCLFYERLHTEFLSAMEAFPHDVYGVAYEDLIVHPDLYLQEIAAFCGLTFRDKPLPLRDEPNVPGVGVRNVQSGMLQVVHDANSYARQNVTTEDAAYIHQRLDPVYRSMREVFAISPGVRFTKDSPS